MTTWADIRELAGQLKKTQEQTSSSKLFERTWVDVIRQLINSNRLKLIFTTDGRSYLTIPELDKEIREEVEAHSGRIALSEIASNLEVDLGIIESRVTELIASDAQCKSPNRLIGIPGEVVNESYVRHLAHEIQDKLEVSGQTSVGELATSLDLPTAFVMNIMQDYQGTLFRVHKYGEKYITDTFMNLTRAKIRGYFTALLRPVTLNVAASKLQVPENLLASILSSLMSSGRLNGSFAAGRGTYIPSCYSRAEDDYVDDFYNQNGYIEWNYLKRFGIADPGTYLKSRFPNAIHVAGVTVGSLIVDQLKDLADEAVRDSSWSDMGHSMPTCLNSKERLALLHPITKDLPVKVVEDGLFLVADAFVHNCESLFESFIKNQASFAFEEQRKLGFNIPTHTDIGDGDDEFVDDPSSKRTSGTNKTSAGGGGGGGGFGIGSREIKTKSVKKKYNPNKRRGAGHSRQTDDGHTMDRSDSGPNSLCSRYMTLDILTDTLTTALPKDVPNEVVSSTVELLLPKLHQSFLKCLSSMSTPMFDGASKRATLVRTQEAINNMLLNIQLLERGIQQIHVPSLQSQLLRHLIKDHGSHVIGQLCEFIAQDFDIPWPQSQQTDQTDSNSTPINDDPKPHFSSNEPISLMTCQRFVELLKHLGTPDSNRLVPLVQRLVDNLRLSTKLTDLSDYYTSLQTLAIDNLGFKLTACTSLTSKSDNKRDRDQRLRANELAIQVELQLKESCDELETNPNADSLKLATKSALAATCLFGHVVAGWPITAPGKCVPELIQWLEENLKQDIGKTHPTSKSFAILKDSQAITNLASLASVIAEHVRLGKSCDDDRLTVMELVKSIVEVASQCRKQLYAISS